jgi:hypothetical protein
MLLVLASFVHRPLWRDVFGFRYKNDCNRHPCLSYAYQTAKELK